MLFVLIGRAAQFILLLVTLKIATSLMTPHEFGRMSLVVSVVSVFLFLFINPLGMYINRKIHQWEEFGVTRRMLRLYWIYISIISIFAAFAIYISKSAGLLHIDMAIYWLFILVSGSILFNTVNLTYIPSLNLLGYQKLFIYLTISTVALSLILAIISTYIYGYIAEYWLLGILSGQTILAIIARSLFNGRINQVPRGGYQQENAITIFNYSWPISLSVGMTWFLLHGYRFVIEDAYGMHELGIFFAGYSISAGIIVGFESVFSTYFHPGFYKKISNNMYSSYSGAWNVYFDALLPSLLLSVALLISLAPELALMLLGKEFQESSKYIVWGAIIEGFRATAGIYSMAAHATMNTRQLITPNMVGAALALIMFYMISGDPNISMIAIILLSSWIVITIMLYLKVRKSIYIAYNYSRIINSIIGCIILLVLSLFTRNISVNSHALQVIIQITVITILFTIMQIYFIRKYIGKKSINGNTV